MIKKFNFLNIAVDEQDIDVYISGEIVDDNLKDLYDYFGVQNVSPNEFRMMLMDNSDKNLTIHINSFGGDLFAGVAMYNAIMDFKGKTIAVIDGIAASAATLPMVACDRVKMNAPSTIMIHCASMGTAGNKHDLQHDIEVLNTLDTAIANAYELKTSLKRDELLKMMSNETWMDCKEAKRLGFVDEIDVRFNVNDEILQNAITMQKAIYASAQNPRADLQVRAEFYNNLYQQEIENTKDSVDTDFAFIKLQLQIGESI